MSLCAGGGKGESRQDWGLGAGNEEGGLCGDAPQTALPALLCAQRGVAPALGRRQVPTPDPGTARKPLPQGEAAMARAGTPGSPVPCKRLGGDRLLAGLCVCPATSSCPVYSGSAEASPRLGDRSPSVSEGKVGSHKPLSKTSSETFTPPPPLGLAPNERTAHGRGQTLAG